MAFVGYVLGMKGYDSRRDLGWAVVAVVWAAAIGFGLGTIFSKAITEKWIVRYWVATLAIVGIFFGDLILLGAQILDESSTTQYILANVIGASAGAMIGLLAGKSHLRRHQQAGQNGKMKSA
jgi:hypothetical protein